MAVAVAAVAGILAQFRVLGKTRVQDKSQTGRRLSQVAEEIRERERELNKELNEIGSSCKELNKVE